MKRSNDGKDKKTKRPYERTVASAETNARSGHGGANLGAGDEFEETVALHGLNARFGHGVTSKGASSDDRRAATTSGLTIVEDPS